MYQRALAGLETENTLRPKTLFTLDTFKGLGVLYQQQGKFDVAEQRRMRALLPRDSIGDFSTVY